MRIGFTGTRKGMTSIQSQVVFDEMMLCNAGPHDEVTEAHHGCCIGADAQFDVMLAYMPKTCVVHGHPPLITTAMAADLNCDVMHPPRDYLPRNRDIVDAVDTLFAAPSGEEELRSGTWSTVRYARKRGIHICVIMPNGHIRFERGKGGVF